MPDVLIEPNDIVRCADKPKHSPYNYLIQDAFYEIAEVHKADTDGKYPFYSTKERPGIFVYSKFFRPFCAHDFKPGDRVLFHGHSAIIVRQEKSPYSDDKRCWRVFYDAHPMGWSQPELGHSELKPLCGRAPYMFKQRLFTGDPVLAPRSHHDIAEWLIVSGDRVWTPAGHGEVVEIYLSTTESWDWALMYEPRRQCKVRLDSGAEQGFKIGEIWRLEAKRPGDPGTVAFPLNYPFAIEPKNSVAVGSQCVAQGSYSNGMTPSKMISVKPDPTLGDQTATIQKHCCHCGHALQPHLTTDGSDFCTKECMEKRGVWKSTSTVAPDATPTVDRRCCKCNEPVLTQDVCYDCAKLCRVCNQEPCGTSGVCDGCQEDRSNMLGRALTDSEKMMQATEFEQYAQMLARRAEAKREEEIKTSLQLRLKANEVRSALKEGLMERVENHLHCDIGGLYGDIYKELI